VQVHSIERDDKVFKVRSLVLLHVPRSEAETDPPHGQLNLDLSTSATADDLATAVEAATGIAGHEQAIKFVNEAPLERLAAARACGVARRVKVAISVQDYPLQVFVRDINGRTVLFVPLLCNELLADLATPRSSSSPSRSRRQPPCSSAPSRREPRSLLVSR
jgi:hypothetical protein